MISPADPIMMAPWRLVPVSKADWLTSNQPPNVQNP